MRIRITARGVSLLVALCLFLLPAAARANQGGFAADFALSRDPRVVVVEYDREIDAIAEPERAPFLRIYGDGRYVVHYPEYMQRAGDWQGRVPPEQIDALVAAAIDGRLLEFDPVAVERRLARHEAARRQALRATGEPSLFEVSDRESTRIRFRLESYKPAGVVGAVAAPAEREVLWWGLRGDLRRHPEIEPLRELGALEERLRALAEAPGLERLPGDR